MNGWAEYEGNKKPEFRAACEGGGSCLEVAILGTVVLVRDSKDPDGPVLAFSHTEWAEFLIGAKLGEFDL